MSYSRAVLTFCTKILTDLRSLCLDRRLALRTKLKQFLLLIALLLVTAAFSAVSHYLAGSSLF